MRSSVVLPAPFGPEQPEHSGAGLQVDPGHGLRAAETLGQFGDLNVHDVPLGMRVADEHDRGAAGRECQVGNHQAGGGDRRGRRPVAARAASTVMTQPASPAATPTLAERASVAAARASAQTAVIGTSQPKVTPAALPTTAEAASPSAASRPNTASARTSSTIRSLTAMLHESSQAGSMPGP